MPQQQQQQQQQQSGVNYRAATKVAANKYVFHEEYLVKMPEKLLQSTWGPQILH